MGARRGICRRIGKVYIAPFSHSACIECTYQAAAAIEGIVADTGDRVRDGDGGQAVAGSEGTHADAGDRAGNGDATTSPDISQQCVFRTAVINEIPIYNAIHGVSAPTCPRCCTIIFYMSYIREGIVADTGDRAGDSDGGQAAAAREGRVADAGDRVADGDGGQTAATPEGIPADAGDRVRDGDGGQAAAA